MKCTLTILSLTAGLLLTVSRPAQAQTGTLSGQTRDAQGAPVPFANVLLLHLPDSAVLTAAVADDQGQYNLADVAPGTYALQARLLSYRPSAAVAVAVPAAGGTVTVPPLVLGAAQVQLKEVQVTGARPFLEQQADKTVLHVGSSIGSAGSTALEVLEKAPGVVFDRQSEVLSLRGKQGVLVLIDGKPSNLPASEVVALLQNLPSNSIDKIELLTNPSARYEAAGNAGIINIALKKSLDLGSNTALTAGVGYGRRAKYNGGVTYNLRRPGVNFFGSYHGAYNPQWALYDNVRTVGTGAESVVLDQLTPRQTDPLTHTAKLGGDFILNPRQTVGVVLSGLGTDQRLHSQNATTLYQPEQALDSVVTLGNRQRTALRSWSGNLNWRRTFAAPGRELTADLDYSAFRRAQGEQLLNRFRGLDQRELSPASRFESHNTADITIYAAKVDYAQPLGAQGRVELGAKSSYVVSDNRANFRRDEQGVWVPDAQLSNDFTYRENINAAYASYKTPLGRTFDLQTGLRLEHTRARGRSASQEQGLRRDYLELFPTVFLTQKLPGQHTLQYSYSRRIDRPSYQQLNPFVSFVSLYTYVQGNPYLNPQFTNNLQLSYTHPQGFMVSGSVNRTRDLIARFPSQDNATRLEVVSSANLDRFDNAALTFTAPLTLTRSWTATSNLNLFYNRFRLRQPDGQPFVNQQAALTFNSTSTWALSRQFSAELSGFYNSPTRFGLGRVQHQWQLSAGAQYTSPSGRTVVKLSYSDLFNTARYNSHLRYQNLDIVFANRWESTQVRLTLTYRLGNDKVKATPGRKTSVSEEQKRLEGN
ncbi:outer membrane beta-barrel protein [Hymenobacter sp. HD11105]